MHQDAGAKVVGAAADSGARAASVLADPLQKITWKNTESGRRKDEGVSASCVLA